MDRLEVRLFNRDAEGMLIERLSESGVVWAAEVVLNIPEYLTGALGAMDAWLGADQILPTGGMLPPCSLDELAELGNDARRMLKRHTQALQMRNSFGVGVFVGNFLMVLAEDDAEEAFGVQMSLRDALTTLGGVTLGPLDLKDTGDLPWAERMEGQLLDLRQRTELSRALIPIVRRHGFLVRRMALLTRRQMMNAQRSMFLAGLLAVGIELGDVVEEQKAMRKRRWREKGASNAKREAGVPEPSREARIEAAGPVGLFHRTDEELAQFLDEESIWEAVHEELEFRLRNNSLRRMLAHLERTKRKQPGKTEGIDGE
jgi:hypothetical protein